MKDGRKLMSWTKVKNPKCHPLLLLKGFWIYSNFTWSNSKNHWPWTCGVACVASTHGKGSIAPPLTHGVLAFHESLPLVFWYFMSLRMFLPKATTPIALPIYYSSTPLSWISLRMFLPKAPTPMALPIYYSSTPLPWISLRMFLPKAPTPMALPIYYSSTPLPWISLRMFLPKAPTPMALPIYYSSTPLPWISGQWVLEVLVLVRLWLFMFPDFVF